MANAALITKIENLVNVCSNEEEFASCCKEFVKGPCNRRVNDGHVRSWKDCYHFLVDRMRIQDSELSKYTIAFEYIEPGCYKRPDVIVLTKGKILILEFKQKREILYDDVVQLGKYTSDISHYHKVTTQKNMEVISYLVYTIDGCIANEDGYDINYLTPKTFKGTMIELLSGEEPADEKSVTEWFEATWEPDSDMQEETLNLWENGDTSTINNIRDQYVEGPRNCIESIINNPQLQKNLIFLGGVPGSGKTMLGMQIVYKYARLEREKKSNLSPIYISGNGPLVNILQKTLSGANDSSGESYIKEIANFKRVMNVNTEAKYSLIVFDEAQRAWIEDQDQNSKQKSEPKALIEYAESVYLEKGRITIIALIGDGQVIRPKREKAGLQSWVDALKDTDGWNVFIPEKKGFIEYFPEIEDSNKKDLYLDISFRSGFTNINPWVEGLLSLDKGSMCKEIENIAKKGFSIKIFRKCSYIEKIVAYERIENNDTHVGLIMSSNGEKLNPEKIFPKGFENNRIKKKHAYGWYYSCHALLNAASEFVMQGIEIDCPIVTFVGDYYIDDGSWTINKKLKGVDEDIIKNVYRVLLTRARKRLYIYIPEAIDYLSETYSFLRKAGISEIDDDYFADRELNEEALCNSRRVICKKCGAKKTRRRRRTDGKHFYGCSNFPNCKG